MDHTCSHASTAPHLPHYSMALSLCTLSQTLFPFLNSQFIHANASIASSSLTHSKNQSPGRFIYGVRKLLKMEWMSGRVRVWLDSWVTGCNLVPVPGSILVFGLSCCDVAEFYWVCCSGFTWTERTGLLLPLALGTVLTVSGEHPQPRHFFFVLKLKLKLARFL